MFILDTDHIGILQRQSGAGFYRLLERLAQFPRSAFHLPIISFHEQALGWHTYINRAKSIEQVINGYRMFQLVLKDFNTFKVLAFDDSAGEVFLSLRKMKLRVGSMDLRIGSIALANGFTLLTRNFVDFQKVPGLKVEDWTAGPPR
jgi:tRNA(fMet)-specific endonuclease VapC